MEKEFYEEFEDMEAGIDQKQALVEESKKVDEIEDFNEAVRFVNDLKKKWRKTGFGESLAEEKLREEFEANVEKVYEKQKALSQKVVEAKEALIKEAEKTSLSDDFKKATEKMTSLMDEWKASGNAGKKTDDELWERFNAARQKFYDRKHANWENRAAQFENAKKVKEDLIEKARSLQDSEEWQKTSAKYKELMDAWKAAGNAGREFDDELWNAFNEARQKFYAKRNEFYEKLHAEHDEKYAEKVPLKPAPAVSDRPAEEQGRKLGTRQWILFAIAAFGVAILLGILAPSGKKKGKASSKTEETADQRNKELSQNSKAEKKEGSHEKNEEEK